MKSNTLLDLDKRSRLVTLMLKSIILLSFYASVINNVLTQRLFPTTTADEIYGFSSSGPMFYVRTAITLSILGLSCLSLFLSTTQNKKYSGNEIVIWGSAIILSCGPLFSSFLGYKHTLAPQWLVLPLSFTILLILEHHDLKWFVKQFRLLCLVYIYGSLLNAAFFPSDANEAYDMGLFSFRLFGIAGHANSLAPMAFLFFIVNRLFTDKKRIINWLHNIAAAMVLLLTQSKTTWIATFIIIAFTWLIIKGKKTSLHLALSFFIAGGAVIVIYAFTKELSNTMSSDQMQSLTTFTGRTEVWDYTKELWSKNPLFGYGLGLWRDETRLQFYSLYGWAPYHSHNQLLQTLGQSGLFGVITLIIYLMSSFFFVIKLGEKSRWTILSIYLLMIIRSFSEIPFESNLYKENYIIHFAGFALLMLYVKVNNEESKILSNEHRVRMFGNRLVFAPHRRVVNH